MFRRAILLTSRSLSTSTSLPSAAVRRYQHASPVINSLRPSIAFAGRRAYSQEPGKEEGDKAREVEQEEKETEAAKNGGANGGGKNTSEGDALATMLEEVNKCKSELEAKVKEAAELKDKFLRSIADFRNLQDRTEREIRSAKDFAIQKFAKDLIESVDNMDLALNAVPEASRNSDAAENKDLVDLYNGLRMTETILLNTLKKHGLEKVNPLGDKFDPNIHEATFQAKIEGKEPGTVFHVQRTGFLLNGRVLRAAQVGVVQAP
ncbi:GrpE-domain-containing protein [Kalaharituber pfeilii]|nr:GrpE-domain-containing protein [Kalaharituber pfeilii]